METPGACKYHEPSIPLCREKRRGKVDVSDLHCFSDGKRTLEIRPGAEFEYSDCE